jgi:hypothetical protein
LGFVRVLQESPRSIIMESTALRCKYSLKTPPLQKNPVFAKQACRHAACRVQAGVASAAQKPNAKAPKPLLDFVNPEVRTFASGSWSPTASSFWRTSLSTCSMGSNTQAHMHLFVSRVLVLGRGGGRAATHTGPHVSVTPHHTRSLYRQGGAFVRGAEAQMTSLCCAVLRVQ